MTSKSQIVFILLVISLLSYLVYEKHTKDNKCKSICYPDIYIQYINIDNYEYCSCRGINSIYVKELK